MLGADDASKQASFDALRSYPNGLHLGGGVNPENAAQYLEAGASHVIVTSYVFNGEWLINVRIPTLDSLTTSSRFASTRFPIYFSHTCRR